ncbi:MAG: phosphorylase [Leptolyngbyaceae cyanobacterium]
MTPLIPTILVPQGMECQAVARGLRGSPNPPQIQPLPMGMAPVRDCLKTLCQSGQLVTGQSVLVMGLCGSLMPAHAVGDGVLYQDCRLPHQILPCDRPLTETVHQQLGDAVALVHALTSDRVITAAAEKQHLAAQFHTAVVDMEGAAILEVLGQAGIAVVMLRAVSDDCHLDLPDLGSAIAPDGGLRPLPLARSLLSRPIAATHLIRGSLAGLKQLERLTHQMFA